MEVVSFKRTQKGITVHRRTKNKDHPEGLNLDKCPDAPSKGFIAAIEIVRTAIVKRCAIKGATFGEAFTLTGISVSKDSGGNRQFTPTGILAYGWGESGVSLPMLREKVDNEKGKSILSDVELKHVEALLAEAGKCASGAREQAEMDLDEAAEG